MKQKQVYLRNASFTALFFVLLGYVVKFYPEQLVDLDAFFHNLLRGDLPAGATKFWSTITLLGNPEIFFSLSLLVGAFFYFKQWKAEVLYLFASMAVMGVLSTALKYLYQRPRPSIEWLMDTVGYSYPSWHTASTLLLAGVGVVLLQQRLQQQSLRLVIQVALVGLAVLVALSRIYLGMHYMTDIVGGWLLSFTVLQLLYPFYDERRFVWRFQSKQK